MNVSVLEREAITWDTPVSQWERLAGDDPLSDELAEEASELLGYTLLAKKKREARRQRTLEQTLAEYDIRPFTPESVRKYKQACEVNPSRFWPTIVESVIGLSFTLAMGALGGLFFSALLMNTMLSFYCALTVIGGVLVGIVFGCCSGAGIVQRKWRLRELASYTEPIPEYALQTALDIKKKHSGVSFYVDVLEENHIVVDPFLVMRVQSGNVIQDCYIEVWNESAFCGEREA
ncbi:hypothetical protein Pan97_48400 [Bremerella volcania]|uniref:Uncharacterized protein n=1 Tax=Bremerella volcania TaxID=2527984 RepID=A0A518CEX3_9BACT|nr:magnesium transporter [Bremerella volcania]QDU77761.1 hypothetical protein Pan97_48400 [Bremerella volcania]